MGGKSSRPSKYGNKDNHPVVKYLKKNDHEICLACTRKAKKEYDKIHKKSKGYVHTTCFTNADYNARFRLGDNQGLAKECSHFTNALDQIKAHVETEVKDQDLKLCDTCIRGAASEWVDNKETTTGAQEETTIGAQEEPTIEKFVFKNDVYYHKTNNALTTCKHFARIEEANVTLCVSCLKKAADEYGKSSPRANTPPEKIKYIDTDYNSPAWLGRGLTTCTHAAKEAADKAMAEERKNAKAMYQQSIRFANYDTLDDKWEMPLETSDGASERRLAALATTSPASEPAFSWITAFLALFMLVLFYLVLRRFGFSKPERSLSRRQSLVVPLEEIVVESHGKRN